MRVKILDENRTNYGVFDDNDVQVETGPILLEWIAEASGKRALVDVIAEHLGQSNVSTVIEGAHIADADAGFFVPHEHPEYMTALPDHEHGLIPHIHMLREEDEKRVAGIEYDAKVLDAKVMKATGELRGDILTHNHPGYSDLAHQHSELIVELQLINRKLLISEQHVHTEVPEHAHPQFPALREQLDQLAARVTNQDRLLAEILSRLTKLEQRPEQDLHHTHQEFALQIQLDDHLRQVSQKEYFTAELSSQDVNGKKTFIVREVAQ